MSDALDDKNGLDWSLPARLRRVATTLGDAMHNEAADRIEQLERELAQAKRDIEFDKHHAAEVLAKIEKAHKHICDLAAGRERWTMRIPARPDMDSDLMIGDALDSARKLIESVAPSAGGTRELVNDDFPEMGAVIRRSRL